jgi:two-component system sensor histidine kinase HupT/HoxJ
MSIRDNGPGIEQDALSRIFDPYFTTRAGGTGLGLALCAMIARNHDATLVASNPADGGAEFKFTLPHVRFKVAPASLPTASAGAAVINDRQQPTPLEHANHGAVIHG